jgi:TetR/AcrR family transcriptional regulator, cholesterol catabolism regulator
MHTDATSDRFLIEPGREIDNQMVKKKVGNRGWQRRKANIDTKAEILKAAGRLFATKSYQGTSVADIAKVLGITVPGLYNHYKSKRDILYTLLVSSFEDLVSCCENAVEKADTPTERLLRFVEAHTVFLLQNRDVAPVADAHLFYGVQALTPTQKKHIMGFERDLVSQLDAVLKAGKKSGEFVIEDMTVSRFCVLGMIEHTVYWVKEDGRLTTKGTAKKVARAALASVSA